MWRRWWAEKRARAVPQQQELDLHVQLATACMRISVLEDRQDKLEGQYKSLRGYVYAKKGLVGPTGEPPPGDAPAPSVVAGAPTASKEELRRQLTQTGRFVPGKPAIHSKPE